MPAKRPAKPARKAPAKASAKTAPARAKSSPVHPNDPALSTLLARLEQLYDFVDKAVTRQRSAHPNDPALSSLLGRLATLEDRLDKISRQLEFGVPAAKPSAAPPVVRGGAKSAAPDTDTAQFLSRTPLFAKLSAAECMTLAQYLEAKTLAAGANLFNQGDFGDAMYVVKTGALEIMKKDVLGEMRVAEVRPGSLVGEMALVEDKPRSAHVRASEDSRLLLLSRSAYADLKKVHPQVATKFQDELLLLLSNRLRQTTEKLVGKTS